MDYYYFLIARDENPEDFFIQQLYYFLFINLSLFRD